jgi:drug/metabolite transporter (DMT)-like permease
LFQGVLFGCCAFFALNYAVLTVGSQTVGVLSALVPVAGALCALVITRDPISGLEWTAIVSISSGVALACLPARSVAAIRRGDAAFDVRMPSSRSAERVAMRRN